MANTVRLLTRTVRCCAKIGLDTSVEAAGRSACASKAGSSEAQG